MFCIDLGISVSVGIFWNSGGYLDRVPGQSFGTIDLVFKKYFLYNEDM